MYEESIFISSPATNEVKIWRYMDFTKFISLLDSKTLFFTRADKFFDPFEGCYSNYNLKMRPILYKDIIPSNIIDSMEKTFRQFRKYTLVSCWHQNSFESAAMWKLYLKSDEGVAIQTTFGRLKESFCDATEKVYIGEVQYIDYDNEWIPEGNTFSPFLYKRKSFEHENEVRALIQEFPSSGHQLDLNRDICEVGKNIKIDIVKLIENVYVSPTAGKWFYELISSLINKFGLNLNVIQSNLYSGPIV